MSNTATMASLSQVMTRLAKEKGIHREFRMNQNGEMTLQDNNYNYQPHDLVIIKTYRFEGASDPADNVILYIISDQFNNKGYIIDAYGVDSNNYSEEHNHFIREIPMEDHEEYELL